MSYYDSTVASYNNQIYSNNKRIDECIQRIRQLEDDIEDLQRVKTRVHGVDTAVTMATNGTAKKISNLPSAITNPFSVLKMNYFSSFLDVIKGNEHTRAQKGIESANAKINAQIGKLQREIESLRSEINRCNSNIRSLRWQRNNYIAAATAPKPETGSLEGKKE